MDGLEMTDEEIRNAASAAFWEHAGDADEAAEAVYRAGMAAERARCIAIAEGQVYDTPDGCRAVAYIKAHYDGVHAVVDALKAPTKGE